MLEIISCSRRTDIPAFYYDWIQECLKNKVATVKNPYNQSDYRVDLSPEKVHSICLWSKNFARVIENSGYLSCYPLYFQFTVTGYSKVLERNVVETTEAVRQMEQLAKVYSPQQVNWRFDPIMICAEGELKSMQDYADDARLRMFKALCRDLSSFGINRCTISFLYLYRKVVQRLSRAKINYILPSDQQQQEMVCRMVEIADKYGITLYSCCSPVVERVPGMKQSHCIDGPYLEQLFGKKASRAKDTGQREGCGCTRSRDIGSYDIQACRHGCLYCYGT